MKHAFVAAGLSALAFFAPSCGGARCPIERFTDARAALARHASLREGVRSIRAEARVEQRGRQGRVRGTVYAFVERPDRVRFDVMTQLGAAAILTSDGRRFQLVDLREHRYLVGPTCPENIARLLGIALDATEVTRVLLGDAPSAIDDGTLECGGEGYIVRRTTPEGGFEELELAVPRDDRARPPAEQRLELRRAERFDASGRSTVRITLDEYQTVEGGGARVSMPHSVRVVDRPRGADTLVRFRRIDLNVDVPGDAFVQAEPSGLPPELVTCDAPEADFELAAPPSR
jgi:outer membrane lipoprotein-sorting protein